MTLFSKNWDKRLIIYNRFYLEQTFWPRLCERSPKACLITKRWYHTINIHHDDSWPDLMQMGYLIIQSNRSCSVFHFLRAKALKTSYTGLLYWDFILIYNFNVINKYTIKKTCACLTTTIHGRIIYSSIHSTGFVSCSFPHK